MTASPDAARRERRRPPRTDEVLRLLRELERRMEAVEERLDALERTAPPSPAPDAPTCAVELIGCLDDCVDDVEELRRRVRDARSAERRH